MMELEEYRALIKRYNPPTAKGVLFAYAVDTYARLLRYNNLSVSDAIIQLLKDKAHGQVGMGLNRPPPDAQTFMERAWGNLIIASIFVGLGGAIIFGIGYLWRMIKAVS